MENAFHAIILTSGTMIEKNVKVVLQHMCSTKKEENVFAQQANLLIQDLHVFNAYNQVIGIQIKEDAYNVQMNKFMIDWRDIVHLVLKMLLFSRIMNAMLVLKIVITIEQEWYVLFAQKDKFTTTSLKNVNVLQINHIVKMIFAFHAILLIFGMISVWNAKLALKLSFMIWTEENVNVQLNPLIWHQIIFVLNVILLVFGSLKPGNVWNAKVRIFTVTIKTDAFALNKLLINSKDVVLDVFNLNIGTL